MAGEFSICALKKDILRNLSSNPGFDHNITQERTTDICVPLPLQLIPFRS